MSRSRLVPGLRAALPDIRHVTRLHVAVSFAVLGGMLASLAARTPIEAIGAVLGTAAALLPLLLWLLPRMARVARRQGRWAALSALVLLVGAACHGVIKNGPGVPAPADGPLADGLWAQTYTIDWKPVGDGGVAGAPTYQFELSGAPEHECNYIACWNLIAMTWEGYVRVPTEGDYTINNYADDGAKIWIDGNVALDNWFMGGFFGGNSRSATVHLTAGDHAYYEEYYNANGLEADTFTSIPGTTWVNRGSGRGDRLPNEGMPEGLRFNPNQCKCAQPVDPATSATGDFYHTEVDASVPGLGFGLEFARTYNSRDPRQTSLGVGWTHSYATRLTRGADGSVLVVHPDGRYDQYLRNQDGSFAAPSFVSDRLQKTTGGYTLTSKDHSVRRFDAHGHLVSIADQNGQATTLSYGADNHLASVQAAGGRTLTFQYDAGGHLISLTDPAGRVVAYAYTADGRLASVTEPGQLVTRYGYDASGRLQTITAADGTVVLTNTYDDRGRLIKQADALGNSSQLAYDDTNHTTTLTDPRGNQTIDTHDARGFLVRRTSPGNAVAQRTFDANGYPATLTDANGHTTQFQADSHGNILRVTDALGRTHNLSYDASDNLVQSVDARGAVTTLGYDAHNNLVRIDRQLDPSSKATTSLVYDNRGLLQSATDANGHKTTFSYDAVGNLASGADALGRTHSFTYDALGRVVLGTDARGVQTSFEYDAAGRLVRSVADAGGQKLATTLTYDKRGDLLSVTDPNGHTRTFAYDAMGRLVSQTDALGNTTKFGYDALSNRTSVVDPSGQRWSYGYDGQNRLVTATDPLGKSEQLAYDAVGNLVSSTDKLGRVTRLSYDAANQLTELIDAATGHVGFSYDAAGNRTALSDANGHSTRFSYDLARRLLSETDPLGNVWQQTFDPVGNVLSQLDPKQQLTTFTRDAADQLSQVSYADGTRVSFTYDAEGRRASMLDATGTTTWTYDALGRPTRIEQPGTGAVTYSYDSVGNRTGLVLPNGHTLAFSYDAADRLVKVTDAAGRATSYAYDPRGLPIGTTLPNGIMSQRQYDVLGRLIGIQHARGTEVLASFAYTLDAVGNRLQAVETAGRAGDDRDDHDGRTSRGVTLTYRYDALDRLLAVQSSDPRRNETFSYDPAGNRLTATRNGRTTTSTYDAANRLLTSGDRQYTWSANGELLQVTRGRRQQLEQAFNWDARGLLVGVQGRASDDDSDNGDHGDSWVRYQYNGDGVHVGGTAGERKTALLQDLASPLSLLLQETDSSTSEREDADTLIREFVWGPELVSQTESRARAAGEDRDESREAWSAPLADALGSTRPLSDSRGRARGTSAYSAFGVPLGDHEDDREAGRGSVFGFAGEQLDARTGLIDLRTRWYDPQVGRFVRQDSLLHGGPGSQGFNRYAYGVNNPVRYTDPSGRIVPFVVAGGLAVAAAVGVEVSMDVVVAALLATAGTGALWLIAHHPWSVDCPSAESGAGAIAPKTHSDGAPLGEKVKPGASGGPRAGKPIPEADRDETLKPGSECVYCGTPADKQSAGQADHSIPKSRGGDGSLENSQPACNWCNPSKGNRDYPPNAPPGWPSDEPWPPPWQSRWPR